MNATFLFQSGDQIGNDDLSIVNYDLIGDGNNVESYPVAPVLWGEEFLSVRALVQRFSRITSWAAGGNQNPYVVPHFFPGPHDWTTGSVTGTVMDNTNGLATEPPWTWYSHYVSMFVGVRGSMRYKFTSSNSGLTGMAPVFGTDYAAVTATSNYPQTATPAGVLSCAATTDLPMITATAGNYEVLIPYYSNAKYWIVRFSGLITDCYYQRLNAYFTTATAQSANAYMAAGPDIALIRFRRVPGLVARP